MNTVPGIFNCLFGGGKQEHHDDGGVTNRQDNGDSVTLNRDGTVRERVTHELSHPSPFHDEKVTVTKNGEGHVVNVQSGWGKGK